jgi:hypothetical protein
MFLAAAGARVVLTDLPHITPLTRHNVAANCGGGSAAGAPLVVDYAWGEPAAALRQRIAAATAAAAAPPLAQADSIAPGPAAAADGFSEFDLIIGADVLYAPDAHAPLLRSLRELAAPHTQVLISFRQRELGEAGFAGLAAAAGWAVQEVPLELLHPEFQGGEYRVLVLCAL